MKRIFTFLILLILFISGCDPSPGQSTAHKATDVTPTSTIKPTQPAPTPTPEPTLVPTVIIPTNTPPPSENEYYRYITQSGDTAGVLENRFDVFWNEIIKPEDLSAVNFLEPGIELFIPINVRPYKEQPKLIPDVEFIYSLTAKDHDLYELVESYDGYLNSYTEWFVNYGLLTGIDLLTNISRDNTINPKITLALLQFNGNWVEGEEISDEYLLYPLGIEEGLKFNLFNQLGLAIDKLVDGYYGWRDGSLLELTFSDGSTLRLDPRLNAGTVGVMYYFSGDVTRQEWEESLYGQDGFMTLYNDWYGDPWEDEDSTAEHIPGDLEQPELILPFLRNQRWAFTGGPHDAWRIGSPWAGLDFAPAVGEPGCEEPEYQWVLASASGVIARKSNGVIVLDLDGDGNENTGWVLVYLHINGTDHLELGDEVDVTDKLGHPSCLGGRTTGIHIHLVRKYNGEWMLADGPVSFNLGGWTAKDGEEAYSGTLIRDGEIITAYESATDITIITRKPDDP